MPFKHIPLFGSKRNPMRGARDIGAADPNEIVEVTIRVRSRAGKTSPLTDENCKAPIAQRSFMSREEMSASFGAEDADLDTVTSFALKNNFNVLEKSAARRTIVITAPVATVEKVFNVTLRQYDFAGGKFRGRTGEIHVPEELRDLVVGVFGIDNRPQSVPHFRLRPKPPRIHAHAASISYTPPQVAQAYQFPSGFDGSGECIAIIELGGGYNATDLSSYFSQLGVNQPTVVAVSVGSATNSPTGDPSGPDGEVMLDIEVAGSIAPAAKIAVYFAENTDAGFLNAITTAVHDTANRPSVISISWGGPESSWTSQAMTSMDEAFQSAAAMGVTVLVASGDNGSSDGVQDGADHVDFPASSPNVLGCGGTKLEAANGSISSEVVWNELPNEGASGGGVSAFFQLPSWQANAGVPKPSGSAGGRGVPDVAGDADPTTGYVTRVDGQPDVIGGTSAVAPLWAGLIALINQKNGTPAGFVNSLLYSNGANDSAFRDITTGNNGSYKARAGWDACTGLGSPNGAGVAKALAKS